jgi:hypothetical protein
LVADRDDGISCELGIRYPTLQAILSGDKNHQTILVSIIGYITYYVVCYMSCYML